MSQVLGILLLIIVLCGTAAFGPPVITDSAHPPLRLDPDQVRRISRLSQPPTIAADAALLVDLGSGQTLYSLRPHDRLRPASTVKIMTALVTLQQANLEDPVEVSANAAGAQGSRMGLTAGESVTVRDLLYGLLLPSGNDAAVALAEHVAGGEAAFVENMNETASLLGMTDTHFTSPHGLDNPAETISATDLITLTRAALAYPEFARIVAAPVAEMGGRKLVNTNELLTRYHGVDGVKTGTTDAAGECLVASVTSNGHRVVAVLLGSKDRYDEAAALLDYATEGWQWQSADLPNDALAWEVGPNGRRYRLRAVERDDLFLPVWQWPLIQRVRAIDSGSLITSTSPIGTLTLTLSNQLLKQVPLTVWQGP